MAPSARHDVVVVGAGLAGLTAARRLVDGGANVTVLEAAGRVGGRTLSQDHAGVRIDLGGQWLGPTQKRVKALADEFGIPLFDTYDDGKNVLVSDGKRSTYSGAIPKISLVKLISLQTALTALDRKTKRVDVGAPWASRGAARIDAESVDDWARRFVPSRAARGILTAGIRVVFGAEPNEVSMLYLAAYAAAGGSFMELIQTAGGAQERRFIPGAQELSLRCAAQLGERVILNSPVHAITQEGTRLTVSAEAGEWNADAAVVTLPPALAGNIDYHPELPQGRRALTDRFPSGATIKCHLFYEEPFWRAEGLSGQAVLSHGPVSATFDNSSHDAGVASLVAFVVGAPARELGRLSEDERRAAVVRALTEAFGPKAGAPTHYVDKDWSSDPWAGGCPTAFTPPGVLTEHGPSLRAPIGRIHWAGTETSTEWTGYMEGSIASGERAAAEILG
jgi:monoamine oxidase